MIKIEGAISVKAAIKSKKRDIEEVIFDKNNNSKDFIYMNHLAIDNGIKRKFIKLEEFKEYNPGKSFGGVIASASLRREDLFDDGDIFYLSGVEDPYNIGSMLRTLYAFGFKNVLLDARDYTKLDGQILKSSAGAYDFLNIRYTKGTYEELKEYQRKGYLIYTLERGNDSEDIFKEEFKHHPLLIVVGGEKRGISGGAADISDKKLFIPYGSDFRNSLDAASALCSVATLLYKKRQ